MIGMTRSSFAFSARLLLTTAISLVGGTQAVRADMLAYESFSGQAGHTLAGMNGGTGFADAWHAGSFGPDASAKYVVQADSLDGGTTPPMGGRVAALAQYSFGSGLTRDLSTPLGTPGTTAYISVLLRADGTLNEGISGGYFGLTLNASTTTPSLSQDLFIGKPSGSNFAIEDRGGANSHASATAAAIGVSNFLVVRADFAASGADKFTLYVNPTTIDMGPSVVKQDSFLGSINSLSLFASGAFSLDEIRIGTTLGAIFPSPAGTMVPEPASVVMLTLGVLGAAATARVRRSRRRAIVD